MTNEREYVLVCFKVKPYTTTILTALEQGRLRKYSRAEDHTRTQVSILHCSRYRNTPTIWITGTVTTLVLIFFYIFYSVTYPGCFILDPYPNIRIQAFSHRGSGSEHFFITDPTVHEK
jgi:hypothetical protein